MDRRKVTDKRICLVSKKEKKKEEKITHHRISIGFNRGVQHTEDGK